MKRAGFLDGNGDFNKIPIEGEVVMHEGVAYISGGSQNGVCQLLDEEDSVEVREENLIKVENIVLTESSGSFTKEGLLILGEISEGVVVSDTRNKVFLYEENLDERVTKDSTPKDGFVYRRKKNNQPVYVVAVYPEENKVSFWDDDANRFSVTIDKFKKEMKPGKEEDYDIFESVLDEEVLNESSDIAMTWDKGDSLFVLSSTKSGQVTYEYKDKKGEKTGAELKRSFDGLAKRSIGKAYQWVKANCLRVKDDGTATDEGAPKAERRPKTSGDSAEILRQFVDKHVSEIDSDHDFTTFFIDTEKEYKRFGIDVPGLCLVCTDLRATKASLKREELVTKFDKSKTLKRFKDWVKGTVEGIKNQVWYTIYISAKEARANGIKAIREEIGYMGDNGEVLRYPEIGEAVEYKGDWYVVESIDGDWFNLINESADIQAFGRDILVEEELQVTEDTGKEIDGRVVLGSVNETKIFADEDDLLYEGVATILG